MPAQGINGTQPPPSNNTTPRATSPPCRPAPPPAPRPALPPAPRSGPAGLFAALSLAEAGARVVLLERGQPVEQRGRDIGAFIVRRRLDPDSNLCYGAAQGGAAQGRDGAQGGTGHRAARGGGRDGAQGGAGWGGAGFGAGRGAVCCLSAARMSQRLAASR